jgi:MATE family multidrug resistance protein
MNDASQVLDNSEIIAITSKLLLIAIFQISDGIQVVVLGALRGLQDVKFPCTLPLWRIGSSAFLFPIIWVYGAQGCWNLDRTLGRINSGSYFFIHSLCETYKKLVLQNHKE